MKGGMLGVQNKTSTADSKSGPDHTGGSISCWKFPRLWLMSSGVTDTEHGKKLKLKNLDIEALPHKGGFNLAENSPTEGRFTKSARRYTGNE